MPKCSGCGKTVQEFFIKNRELCKKCYNHLKYIKRDKEVCIECKNLRIVEFRSELGPICSSCYNRKKDKQECIFCKKLKIPHSFINNDPVCTSCYRNILQKKEICVDCGELKPAEKRIDGKAICKSCYGKYHQPKRQCVKCLEIKPIKGKNLCQKCYTANRMATDENFRLRQRIWTRLSRILREMGDNSKKIAGRGISIKAISEHLGPCPGDIHDYHIDHIRPLASFDLTDPHQLCLAFAPENHQWLKKEDNLKKGAKYAKMPKL